MLFLYLLYTFRKKINIFVIIKLKIKVSNRSSLFNNENDKITDLTVEIKEVLINILYFYKYNL